MRHRVVYAQSPKWALVVEAADDLIGSSAFTPVKAEGRTRAGFLKLADGTTVFLKCNQTRGRFAGACDRVRGSRSARALRGARILREGGFRCPAPLAAMDVIEGGAIVRTYLLSEPLERAEILSHSALGPALGIRHGYRRRKAVSDALAREVRRLHDAGIYSEDLQETNIMVEQRGGEIAIYFLDLEDIRRARRVSRKRRMMNLVHLDRSIGRFVERAGRLAFLYSYLGAMERRQRRRMLAHYLRLRESVERAHRRRRRAPEVAAAPS